MPIPHGDKDSLILDNPIEEYTAVKQKIRRMSAQRGELTIDKPENDFKLVVKQNALFTALSNQLMEHFSMVAIVRNPISTLASWMTVDLPINRGRIPGGEKFDKKLSSDLASSPDLLKRQLIIYSWFANKFVKAKIPTLKYEDIIASNGNTLLKAFGLSNSYQTPLNSLERVLPTRVIRSLELAVRDLTEEATCGLYTTEEIKIALSNLQY